MEQETLHSNDPSVHSWCQRVIVYFLVTRLSDWRWDPETEGRQSGLLFCSSNCQDKDTDEKQHATSEKRGQRTSLQRCSIFLRTTEGTKVSLQNGSNAFIRAAFQCVSKRGVDLNTAESPAGRTGLNLHFFLLILFSSSKLTPEKTESPCIFTFEPAGSCEKVQTFWEWLHLIHLPPDACALQF